MSDSLCKCGCGQNPGPRLHPDYKRGHRKGDPRDFVSGHENRRREHPPELRQRVSQTLKGHAVTEETRARISATHKALGTRPSEEARAKGNAARGKRELHPNWRGGTSMMANGYRCVYDPEHPRAHQNGYVYEHIVVMEVKLGRALVPGEVVHHVDFVKTNNHPDNLITFPSQAAHIRHHRSLGHLD